MNATLENSTNTATGGRMLSLDVFRGLTIAGMILVNNPGTWSAIYAPLKHAEWHGATPTDFIFPFFLFIVGVSIALAFARRVEQGGTQRDLYWKVTKRTLIIYALGLIMSGFPYFNFSTIRVTGVLPRIALCYFFASVIFLNTKWRAQVAITVALLVIYWMLLTLVPAPGFSAGDLSKEGNLAAHIDRALLGLHIWRGGGRVYDPEGILSTLPAIAMTLCGALAGHWLRSSRTALEKTVGMFLAGFACVVAGWLWGLTFPINKALWTSSYVLYTAGLGLQLLAVCYWLIDIKNFRSRWIVTPFLIFGTNALIVFVLSGLMARAMSLWRIPRASGQMGNLQTFIYDNFFASWASPINASLLYAIAFTSLWLFLMWLLYRKKIFIRV